jgi:hypothetical protein
MIYPILDEEDYSNREYEATFENIADAAWRLKNEYDLPEDWQSAVYSWFADNDYSAIENVDDQGGYPSEEQLKEAFRTLGYQEMAAVYRCRVHSRINHRACVRRQPLGG